MALNKALKKLISKKEIRILKLINNQLVMGYIHEKKNHCEIYSPMLVEFITDKKGNDRSILKPFIPLNLVASDDTVISNDSIIAILAPSLEYIQFYLKTLQNRMVVTVQQPATVAPVANNTNNVITFSRFKEYQQKRANGANLVLVVNNSESSNDSPPEIA